jgi:hypothetical protein
MEDDKEIKNNDKEDKISEEELNTFNNKLHSIQKGINTLKSKFGSLLENIKKDDYELQYGLSFFESKQDMMLIYITNLLNYCYTKILGQDSISESPIISDNIKISSLIERIKVIEMKLQHLINKTINVNNQEKNNNQTTNEMDLKPKILSMYNKNNDDNDEEENNEEESEKSEKNEKKAKKKKKMATYLDKSEIYKIKSENIDFYENKEDKKKRRRQIERDKEKIRNSEMMRSLREEMSDNPINYDNGSNSYYNKYMKEIEDYEKEHFVNITVPKKVIKQLKKKDNNIDDLSKIDTDLKILSNTLNEKNSYNYGKSKDKYKINTKKSKSFLNKKRKHK